MSITYSYMHFSFFRKCVLSSKQIKTDLMQDIPSPYPTRWQILICRSINKGQYVTIEKRSTIINIIKISAQQLILVITIKKKYFKQYNLIFNSHTYISTEQNMRRAQIQRLYQLKGKSCLNLEISSIFLVFNSYA